MKTLYPEKIKFLEKKSNEIRQLVIDSLARSGSGHTAGPLGMADIFTYLYFHGLNHKSDMPDWPERDRLVLSNGHICPVLYATLALAEYFPVTEMKKLRKFKSGLQGHPERGSLPGIETTSGPLGSGLSQTIGMVLADKLDNGPTSERFFYCLLSDGELNEGNSWEAIMLAGREGFHNLIAIVDRNNIQIDGYTEDVMPLEPLADKWRAFNWQVIEINGHNFEEIDEAIGLAKSVFGRPTVIIAHTIPGKGVLAFERKFDWHGKAPNKEEARKALKELRSFSGQLDED